MKVGGIKTWEELTIGVQQLTRLLFNNNFMNSGLVLTGCPKKVRAFEQLLRRCLDLKYLVFNLWYRRDLNLDFATLHIQIGIVFTE